MRSEDFDRRFNFMWRLCICFIFLTFCLVVTGWVITIYTGIKVAGSIEKDGLKTVIERVWEGPNK
jgi:hypothetical protein